MDIFTFFWSVYNYYALKILSWSILGNKIAPPMAHYENASGWPSWCRISFCGSNFISTVFLDFIHEFRHRSPILYQVDNIRLQRLSHYKSRHQWSDGFIRADFLDVEKERPLIMVWQRFVRLTSAGYTKQRELNAVFESGLPSNSLDTVNLMSEADFEKFLFEANAYVLRYVV